MSERPSLSRRAIVSGAVAVPLASVAALAATTAPVLGDLASAQAMLARAEQTIDVLRTRYVCEGWKLDEEAASRTLRYFQRRAAMTDIRPLPQMAQSCGLSSRHRHPQ